MQKIGLLGAVVIIIGTVIGAGIYIMIGPLAVETGPSLIICYFLALIIALTSSICYAQVASIFPATAGTYQYTRMFYSDSLGFFVSWSRYVASFIMLALMGQGFASYFEDILLVDPKILAISIVTIFYIVNMLGIITTKNVQGFLVVIVVSGLVLFFVPGLFRIEAAHLTPLFGAGTGPILKGSVTAFFAYTGIYFVAEIGDEIENPHQNIPRSIFLASLVIGILYLGTALVFSGGLGWETIIRHTPNLADASRIMFSPTLSAIIRVCAIAAIITPINAIYLSSSRGLYSLAREGLMPGIFSTLNRFQAPGHAITFVYVLGVSTIILDLPILFLGTISSVVTLISMSLVAGGCLKIERDYPEQYQKAPMCLSKPVLFACALLTIGAGIILTLVSFYEDPLILYTLVIWTTVGIGYYYFKTGKAGLK